jgi:predicted outer membrane protein
MLTDHTGLNARVNDPLSSADITPTESMTSLALRDESAMKRDEMRELSGRAFDTTYSRRRSKCARRCRGNFAQHRPRSDRVYRFRS